MTKCIATFWPGAEGVKQMSSAALLIEKSEPILTCYVNAALERLVPRFMRKDYTPARHSCMVQMRIGLSSLWLRLKVPSIAF